MVIGGNRCQKPYSFYNHSPPVWWGGSRGVRDPPARAPTPGRPRHARAPEMVDRTSLWCLEYRCEPLGVSLSRWQCTFLIFFACGATEIATISCTITAKSSVLNLWCNMQLNSCLVPAVCCCGLSSFSSYDITPIVMHMVYHE